MTLPEPPPTPRSLDREPEPERDAPALVGALLTVSALIAVAALAFFWLTAEPAPAAPPKPTPHVRVNPCDGDTFDANGCAVRMIQGASKQTGVPPYTVVHIWCSSWSTPKAQREMVDKWVAQGAPSRAKARAVLNEILDYCPGMEEG